MKNYLILTLLLFLLISCSKSINEPEPINLLFKVISYNNISIDNKPEGILIPIKIKLFDYQEGKTLKGAVKISILGWYISMEEFNTMKEMYVNLPEHKINITLTNLVITETEMRGEYCWGFTSDLKSEFVAVIEYIF